MPLAPLLKQFDSGNFVYYSRSRASATPDSVAIVGELEKNRALVYERSESDKTT